MIPAYAPSVQDWMRTVSKEVNPAIFTRGRSTANPPSQASIAWLREPTVPTYPSEGLGGLWSDKVYWDHTISAEFDANNAPVNSPQVSPAVTLMLAAHNKGSDATVCTLQTICGVHASGKSATGVNFISYSGPSLTNVIMKGLEIDIQPDATTTIANAFGIALNAFTKNIPGDAIYIEGVFGGTWQSGVRIGHLDSSIGAGIYAGSGSQMGTLVDSASGTFGQDAICLSNTHKIRFRGTASAHAKQYAHSDNTLRIVGGSAGIAIRNNADSSATLSIGDGALGNYASDAAAATGGVAIGQIYRNGSVVQIRVT